LSQLSAPVWRLLAVTGTADRFDIIQQPANEAASSGSRSRHSAIGRATAPRW
jgi:hypothetical protein